MKNPLTLPIENHEIDALVDGELAEPQRQQLLLRLEQEPAQWRRVALAFLEAQAFQAAWKAPTPATQREVRSAATIKQHTSWRAVFVLAASLMLAFLTGILMQRDPSPPLARATTPAESTAGQEPTPRPVQLTFTMHMPVELRQQLLRCGYEVLEQPKLIHIQQGGRSIPVVVNDLKVRFVGRREVL